MPPAPQPLPAEDPAGADHARREAASDSGRDDSAWTVLLAFLRLGLTSFGGPVAHLSYFREEFVGRRRWLDDAEYLDTVALCQFLPGPASSQVGIALGYRRAGILGSLAAWLGFTAPSAILLAALGSGLASGVLPIPEAAIHGVLVVAVAVVADAVAKMARSACPDTPRLALMIASAVLVLLIPSASVQFLVIGLGALVGLALGHRIGDEGGARGQGGGKGADQQTGARRAPARIPPLALGALALFALLLVALPLARLLVPSGALAMADVYYRAGSLVFGGGHVVLPLLQHEVVPAGWVDESTFLAGYGAAQAVPGPLFTLAAFLGAASSASPNGPLGALLATLAIFIPSFLLVLGALPLWERLAAMPSARSALAGINAAVVGILLAALYTPVWTSAIASPTDAALGLLAFAALHFFRAPAWALVAAGGLLGWALAGVAPGLV